MKNIMKSLVTIVVLVAPMVGYSVIGAGNRPERGIEGGTHSGTPNPALTRDVPARVTPSDMSPILSCSDGKYIPQKLFKNLMDFPSRFEVKLTPNRSAVRIQVPRYVSNCMRMSLTCQQVGNNIHISVQNTFFDTEPGSTMHSDLPTINAKYEACLNDAGVIANGELNRDHASITKQDGFIQECSVRNFDHTKSLSVHYSSPQNLLEEYGTAFANGAVTESPDPCRRSEVLAEGGLKLYVSPQDSALESYEAICEGGSLEEIMRALQELRAGTAGNFQLLQGTLSQVITMLENQLKDKIASELPRWEARLQTLGNEIRAAERTGDMSSSQQRALQDKVREYSSLLNNINRFVIEPEVQNLRRLYEQRGSAEGQAQARIDAQIEQAASKIRKYTEEPFVTRAVVDKIESMGFNENANTAMEFRLSAAAYGNVGFTGNGITGVPRNPDRIQRFIDRRMSEFRDHSELMKERWESENLGTHNSDRYRAQVQSLMNQRNQVLQNYYETEQRLYSECMQYMQGGILYSRYRSSCNEYQQGASSRRQRATLLMNRYNTQIQTSAQNYSGLAQLEQAWERENAEEEGDGEGMGSSEVSSWLTPVFGGTGATASAGQQAVSASPMAAVPTSMMGAPNQFSAMPYSMMGAGMMQQPIMMNQAMMGGMNNQMMGNSGYYMMGM